MSNLLDMLDLKASADYEDIVDRELKDSQQPLPLKLLLRNHNRPLASFFSFNKSMILSCLSVNMDLHKTFC